MATALAHYMRPVTIKSKTELARQARMAPHMHYKKSKDGFLHLSGEGFTNDKTFAWFGAAGQFEALMEKSEFARTTSWEEVRPEE